MEMESFILVYTILRNLYIKKSAEDGNFVKNNLPLEKNPNYATL